MQINEFNQPITSKKLNESLAKNFGCKINLEQFSDMQLEDARNKLRTKISQFEVTESYDTVLESPDYQKTRMFLDVINQEILEREMTQAEQQEQAEQVGIEESMQKEFTGNAVYFATIRQRAMEESVPSAWIDSAIERMELGESDGAELKAELQVRYDLNESVASWVLMEGEEEKAETIMATKDMVDRITGWLEDVAAMKAEQLLELVDSIRETQGSDVAQQWQDAVKPALEAIYTALETSRQGLSQGLGIVSGEQVDTMGAPAGGEEMGPPEEGEAMGTPGGEVPAVPDASREKRESVDYSRRLGMLLASNISKKK